MTHTEAWYVGSIIAGIAAVAAEMGSTKPRVRSSTRDLMDLAILGGFLALATTILHATSRVILTLALGELATTAHAWCMAVPLSLAAFIGLVMRMAAEDGVL